MRNRWRAFLALAAAALLAFGSADARTLAPQDTGNDVAALQTDLQTLGFFHGSIDGKYGTRTENAVRALQKKHRLNVDGKAGSKTQALIAELLGQSQTQPTAVPAQPKNGDLFPKGLRLEKGSSGAYVTSLQNCLKTLGYYTGRTDGNFGRGTYKAVVSFQTVYGMKADGIAGSGTLGRLNQLFRDNSRPQATPKPKPTAAPAPVPVPGDSGLFPRGLRLEKGSTGPYVTRLQDCLKTLGYYTGRSDGKFGSGTHKAVVGFQAATGLKADGIAGSGTLASLERLMNKAPQATAKPQATPAPTATPQIDAPQGVPTRTLRRGNTGEDVRALQQRLIALGFLRGSADGRYGSMTMEAVRAYQRANGLYADGIAGSQTNGLLFASANPPKQTPAPQATNAPGKQPNTKIILRLGARGEEVTQLQNALIRLNYTLTVNGTYDTATRSAVQAFQRRNGLGADGVAGPLTLQKLYGTGNVGGDASLPELEPDAGKMQAPPKSSIKLLHWYNDIKPSIRTGQKLLVYDPATGLSWNLRLYSLGHHADSEPLTLRDTQIMYRAFGNKNDWGPKAVYVRLPNGTWTIAGTHNVPHLRGSIKTNGFDGHLCVHFLRDMSETQKNDPRYGVRNQETIRRLWKQLTGEEIDI